MEIRNWKTGNVIYQAEVDTIKELVEKAVKERVSLAYANLSGADLCGSYLRNASLSDANLNSANLFFADLRGANLLFADLSGADLRDADLSGANLGRADLRDAENVPENLPMACPKDGSFVGWKKVNGKLVKLEIPEDAKRSSATSKKCRCSKAKVLEITDYLDDTNPIDEVVNQNYGQYTIYRVGEMVYPDSFDDNRWNECSHGIHFFMDKQDAIDY